MSVRKCASCHTMLPEGSHFNQKRCAPCVIELRRKPLGTMTAAQIRKAIAMAGKVPRAEIAERLGVSLANLKRSCPNTKFATTWIYKMNPERTREIIHYYFKHGKRATEEKFPDTNVKAIVDRPEYYGVPREYRQTRWKDSELLESIKMAGLVSFPAQAKYFSRPGANAGSIKSLWVKRHRQPWSEINGMVKHKARRLVAFNVKGRRHYIKTVGTSRDGDPSYSGRKIMLWVDLERSLKPDLPEFIKAGVRAMADFQRWLWDSPDPAPLIKRMIKEREIGEC